MVITATTVTRWLTAVLVTSALVPTVWVLGREAVRRKMTKSALRKIEAAMSLAGKEGDPAEVAASLKKQFDPMTVDRVVVQLIRGEDEKLREWGQKLFAELNLVEVYGKLLRESTKWSERTNAAEVLGLAAVASAIPALVAALNDRFEDEDSVKVASASALAKLKDPTAIPLLIKELIAVDERSSRNIADSLAAFGPLAVSPLRELLGDANHAAGRVWAARILGRIGESRSVEDLIARLSDRDDLLRMAAAESLGLIADPRAMQPLVRATLRDPAPQVRAQSASAMALVDGPRAIDVLVSALADPDYATRLRALEAFETIEVADTSHLESALRDPNVEVRRRAALALERVGYVERIIVDLTSTDKEKCEHAYSALLEVGRVGLVDGVAAYLHHESFEVRALVAKACGEIGVSRIAPLLIGRLDDALWPVRAALVESIGRLKPEGGAQALVPLLADDEETVREAAADALTNFPAPDLANHMEALSNAYARGSIRVRMQTISLLAHFEGKEADELLVRATTDPSDVVRVRAVTALGHRGGEIATAPLVARLTDASLEVRMAAIEGLGSAAGSEAFAGLLSALSEAPRDVRDRIAEALSRSARPQLLSHLPDLKENPSLEVRLGVAWTLGKCGDAAGIPTLAYFLADPSADLRASAAGALAKIPDPQVTEVLLGAVEDPNGRVRAAVVNALIGSKQGEERVVAALIKRTQDPDGFVRDRALVTLAMLQRGELESRFAEISRESGHSARLVAQAIIGTDTAIAPVLDVLHEPGTLEGIASFLSHEHPTVRGAFFAAVHLDDLAKSKDAPIDVTGIIDNYEQLLRTSLDVSARRFAVAALGRLSGGRTVEVIADALASDPAEQVRLQAARALNTHAESAIARKGLTRAVADPSADVATHAVRALAGRREPEVARALMDRLGAGAQSVQHVVELTLADMNREDPVPFMDWMMGVDIPDLLIPAVRVLEGMASPPTFFLLSQLVHSTSAGLRAASVRALGKLPMDDAAKLIDEMVEDPAEDVRLAVMDTIVWSGESLLRASLLRRDPQVRVRTQLAVSLARFRGAATKSALKVIESLMEDSSPKVRAAALVTAMLSADPDGLQMFARAWQTATLDTRFEVKAESRGIVVAEHLATQLGSVGDSAVRKHAILAMGAVAPEGFQKYLFPSLSDPSPEVRVAVIQALAPVEDVEVKKRLSAMLADPEVAVRDAARRSILRSVG